MSDSGRTRRFWTPGDERRDWAEPKACGEEPFKHICTPGTLNMHGFSASGVYN